MIFQTRSSARFIFILDEWDYIFYQDYAAEQDKKAYLQLLRSLLKDKPYVLLTYMTGILPIAKYTSGSELNMFSEFTMAKTPMFSSCFGFTEQEVNELHKRYLNMCRNPSIGMDDLKNWYDGYHAADGERIYNPRSVVLALRCNHLENYWTSSGPYDEIFYYIAHNVNDVCGDIALMVSGQDVHARLQEYAATSMDLQTKDEIFSAMVVYGFLSYENGRVSIPNRELMEILKEILKEEIKKLKNISRNYNKRIHIMSLKKIAQITGASAATVSRVLNNPDYHCQNRELTEKIRQAARELGYVPNQNARMLKLGENRAYAHGDRQYRIDILLARFDSLEEDPFFAEMFRYVETECHKLGCVIGRIMHVTDVPAVEAEGGRVRADGLIILGKCPAASADVLLRRYGGVAAIDRNPMDYRMDEITCNGAHAAVMAVEYLLELGHTSIAYVGDCTMEARYNGYYECLAKHKISMIYDYIVSTNQTREEGGRAFERLAALKKPPTAVFCANDVTALGLLGAMKAYNGRRRRDIYRPAVISIDDVEEAVRCSPMLTTIQIPKGDMAHLAVQLLKDRLQGGHQECVRLELPCRLLVRESAGMYVP